MANAVPDAPTVETYRDLIGILAEHVGETGESEGAVAVLHRLLREHTCPLNRSGTKGVAVGDTHVECDACWKGVGGPHPHTKSARAS